MLFQVLPKLLDRLSKSRQKREIDNVHAVVLQYHQMSRVNKDGFEGLNIEQTTADNKLKWWKTTTQKKT